MDLGKVIEELRKEGKLLVTDRILKRRYEVTKVIKDAETRKACVLYRVEGFSGLCVSNVIYSRDALYRYLGISNDEELYELINDIISLSPKDINELISNSYFILHDFSSFYRLFNGSLSNLPAIKFFEGDGGPYFTSSIVISEIPSMPKHYNASIHRLMLLSNDELVIRLVPRHLYSIYKENIGKGQETPVAIVFGVHPIIELLASISPPYGSFELSGYRHVTKEPLGIVLTPEYGIPIPASASVVIEGRITEELADEGPFTDLLMLYDRVRKQPIVKVDRIYININNIPFHIILPSGIEHMLLMGLPREAAIWGSVSRAVPKVVKVRLTRGGGGWLHAVISIKKFSEGDGKTAIFAAFAAHPSLKHVVVVDDDINPDNPYDVEWAIATRFQADRDLVVITNARGSSLDPSSKDGLTAKLGIDATAPLSNRELFARARIGDEGD